MSRARTAAAVILVVLLGASVAGAEIYRWTDSSGRMHFTHDLSQVPPGQRKQAEAAASAPKGPNPIQTYQAPARVAPRRARAAKRESSSAGTVRVRVAKAGNSMRVRVRLNGLVDVPFIVDTGASDVVVPRKYVDQLGIDLNGARTGRYSTANGTIETPLIQLASVDLQGARADNVPAAVSDSMDVGLLGLSFFNRFKYHVDPGQGLITLTPNGLEDAGLIRGGRSESDWRSEFAQLGHRLKRIEERRENMPWTRSRARERLEDEAAEIKRQHRALEREADDAKVPYGWRD